MSINIQSKNKSKPKESNPIKEIILFHGSNIEVREPQIIESKFKKDFGFAFYCTKDEKQAKKRAVTKSETNGQPVICSYGYTNNPNLNVKTFETMTDEWLDFIIACRSGEKHEYDIVEGPMADDKIYNYIEDFYDGKITRAAFWELAKFKHPTHQIALCTEKALSAIRFLSSKTLQNEKAIKKRAQFKR